MTNRTQTPSVQDFILNKIDKLSGQKNLLVVPRIFISITGSINSAVLLSQILYWSDKSSNKKYRNRLIFAKTKTDFENELGLGRRAFDNAQKMLEDLELIITKEGGFAGKKCIYWQPNIESILSLIQSYVSAHENKVDAPFQEDVLLAGFKNTNLPDMQNKCAKSLAQVGQMDESKSSNEVCMNESYPGSFKPDHMSLESTFNTETISKNTSKNNYTNQQPETDTVGGGVIKNKEPNENEFITRDSIALINSLDKSMSEEVAIRLITDLEKTLRKYPRLSKGQIELILIFSVVTGYKDFEKSDLKNGKLRSFPERWIEPIQAWERNSVTVDDIRLAMNGAIKEKFHNKLTCPASYSPRVLAIKEKLMTTSNHYDDEF